MAGRVKEIANEMKDKWDIFFVAKEKKEKRINRKWMSFAKVYQKDKCKGKIGSIPNITIKDNLPPPAQDTPPITTEVLVQPNSQPEDNVEEMTQDDTNPDSNILFTMNVDTWDFNIVMDKETSEVKQTEATNIEISESPVNTIDSQNIEIPFEVKEIDTILDVTQLNIKNPIKEEIKAQTEIGKGQEQSIAELIVSKAESKDDGKVEKKIETQSEKKEELVNNEKVNNGNKIAIEVNVQTSGGDKKPTAEPHTPPSTYTMD